VKIALTIGQTKRYAKVAIFAGRGTLVKTQKNDYFILPRRGGGEKPIG
jgi:hypothetical protein